MSENLFFNPQEAGWEQTRKAILIIYNQLITDEALREEFDEGDLRDVIEIFRGAKDRLYDRMHYWHYRNNPRQWVSDYDAVVAIMKRLSEKGVIKIAEYGKLDGLTEAHSHFLASEHINGVDLRLKYPDEFLVLIWGAWSWDFTHEIDRLRDEYYERVDGIDDEP